MSGAKIGGEAVAGVVALFLPPVEGPHVSWSRATGDD